MQPPQIFFVVQLFGFRNHEGRRRFTEALYATARKNAKSTLAAAINLSVMCLEENRGGQLLSAATTGSQARLPWRVAKLMVERSEALRQEFGLEPYASAIARPEAGSSYKPINAKASTQDGLNPSLVHLDEIHAQKTHDLLNVLRSAAGARKGVLFLYTTTEGYETPGPWPEIRNFALQVLQRLYRADHFLAVVFALDDEDDDFDETKWPKANPLIYVMPNMLGALREMARNAKAMPGQHAEFRIKRLNRRAAAATAWLNLHKWRTRCGGRVPLEELAGAPCWAAWDGASTTDMAAWRLLWLLDDAFYTWGRYWVPADAVAQRTERRSVPYAAWVQAGYITQTEGDVIDYEQIQPAIVEDFARYQPTQVAYDPWNSQQLVTSLTNEGLPMTMFIQGPKSYNPAVKACEVAYTSGRLRHGGDPVLMWNMANLVMRTDANLNQAPDRKRSADKIDGGCALLMCFGLASADDVGAFDRMLSAAVVA